MLRHALREWRCAGLLLSAERRCRPRASVSAGGSFSERRPSWNSEASLAWTVQRSVRTDSCLNGRGAADGMAKFLCRQGDRAFKASVLAAWWGWSRHRSAALRCANRAWSRQESMHERMVRQVVFLVWTGAKASCSGEPTSAASSPDRKRTQSEDAPPMLVEALEEPLEGAFSWGDDDGPPILVAAVPPVQRQPLEESPPIPLAEPRQAHTPSPPERLVHPLSPHPPGQQRAPQGYPSRNRRSAGPEPGWDITTGATGYRAASPDIRSGTAPSASASPGSGRNRDSPSGTTGWWPFVKKT